MSDAQVERLTWRLCPHLHFQLMGSWKDCEQCPAVSPYSLGDGIELPGTKYCRAYADKAACDAMLALPDEGGC